MKNAIVLAFAAAFALSACSSAQLATAQADVQSGVLVVDTGACLAQKAANDATAILTAAGDTAGAAASAKVSTVAGQACLTLAPAPVAATPAS